MLFILFLVFVVTPIVELAVIVQVAGSTGVLNTIGLLVLVSVVGAWLVRREGLGILRRARRTSHAPTTLTSTSSPMVFSTPVEPATCTMTANSTIGVTTNNRNSMNNTTAC